MIDKSVSELIEPYVNFIGPPDAKGWQKCYCEVCGDGSRTKGPRGGWNMDDEKAFYHCFNCGMDANFDITREIPFSRDMRDVFDAFGVPSREYNAVAYSRRDKDKTKPEIYRAKINTFEVPEYFYSLEDAAFNNTIAAEARKFLRTKYGLSDSSYTFYLSNGKYTGTDVKEKNMARMLMNRIIIPYFKNGKLIYYQGRALNDDAKKKYINMDVPRSNILFNMDALYRDYGKPLYVLEGAMDAIHVGGVGVLENNITNQQIELLQKCPRPKVLIPDRKGDSRKLAEVAVNELGWGLSVPDIGSSCKDISEAIVKYGKLYVVDSIVRKTTYGTKSKLALTFL